MSDKNFRLAHTESPRVHRTLVDFPETTRCTPVISRRGYKTTLQPTFQVGVGGISKEVLIQWLSAHNFLTEESEYMMRSRAFKVSPEPKLKSFVALSPIELGFTLGDRPKQFDVFNPNYLRLFSLAYLKGQKISLCDSQDLPFCFMQDEKARVGPLCVAMKPIRDAEGCPRIFSSKMATGGNVGMGHAAGDQDRFLILQNQILFTLEEGVVF